LTIWYLAGNNIGDKNLTTNCVFPPELDGKQLLGYLDNNADKKTISHLQGCAHCRERAKALDRLQKRLTRRLYRLTCPSPIELGEYHLRMLPTPQMLLIGQHLRECPHCEREIAELERFFLADLKPMEDSLLAKAKVLIARLVSERGENQESGGSTLIPVFATLRGEAEGPFIYQADHVQIVIEIQEDAEQPDLKVLLGLVMGFKSNLVTVKVNRNEQIIATTSVDENGNFTIHHLVSGLYELTLTTEEGSEIRIPAIAV
jgi:hypothetical protein